MLIDKVQDVVNHTFGIHWLWNAPRKICSEKVKP